jgi:hypothetical protein
MGNQFTQGPIVQGTTLGLLQPNQLISGGSYQPSSQACIVDLTPPVFSGINLLVRGLIGQLRASWSAGTDATPPISYEVYCKPFTASGLFNVANICGITSQNNFNIFALADGTLLQPGVEYFVGVRAIDAVGNRDTNLVSLSQSSPGIAGVTSGQIGGVFAVNEQNQLIASFWAVDNEGVINNPARLGFASYVIYDEQSSLVPGMAESGIAANAQGFFEIAPVASVLDLNNTYYTVMVTIEIDGVDITYNLPITYPEAGPQYDTRAVFSINASNELQGSLWVTKENQKVVSNLGLASYSIRNKSGALIGISQSNIAADANGVFQITPVNASAIVDFNHYTVDISIVADGLSRSGVVGLVVGE